MGRSSNEGERVDATVLRGNVSGAHSPAERERQIAILMRIVEELTNRPVGSVYQAAEILLEHLTRYRRLQVKLNEVLAYELPDPTHINVIESCSQLADQHAALLRSIRSLNASRGRPATPIFRLTDERSEY